MAADRRVVRTQRHGLQKLLDRVVQHRVVRRILRTSLSSRLRSAIRWRSDHSRWLSQDRQLLLYEGSVMYPVGTRLPRDAILENAEIVLSTADELGIPYTYVRNSTIIRTTVAVPVSHRQQLLEALGKKFGDEAIYATTTDEYVAASDSDISVRSTGPIGGRHQPIGVLSRRSSTAAVVRIWRYYLDRDSGLKYGSNYGCDVEFWEESSDPLTRWSAPRLNAAGDLFSESDVAFLPVKRHAENVPQSVFDLRMINDVDFPIDVVYTWVDSSDPAWRTKFQVHRGQLVTAELHEEASGAQRFRSRDELKYSLRSLAMYAPWIRHVYIVTDQQIPEFINFDHDDISLIDHREISTAPEALPVFNSSAIISWLHHIPGLSDHYVYMNDDVFFGRDVSPSKFFTASGLAKTFPSRNRRPFGSTSVQDEPHINITRNIRSLLEREFGRTISRSVKHTPHAQLVRVQNEMEKRFPDAYAATSRSRFRHHDDIAADQLFHYYGQIAGQAIVGSIRYAYVNIGDDRKSGELERLLLSRGREVFCLNDAPLGGSQAMTDSTVRSFLESYFPVPSQWERY